MRGRGQKGPSTQRQIGRFETDHFYFKWPEQFFGRDAFEYLVELEGALESTEKDDHSEEALPDTDGGSFRREAKEALAPSRLPR